MSRKHYEKLARWVAGERDEGRRAWMASTLADLIAEDNPKFDRGIWHSRILALAALRVAEAPASVPPGSRTHRPHISTVPGGGFRFLADHSGE